MRTLPFILLGIMILAACNPPASSQPPSVMDVQGHRGCRGHWPENSLIGFEKALEMGVSTLEMDIVISQDDQVLVSHEPFLSHEICLSPSGDSITAETEKSWNLYQMQYDSIRQCDCGSIPHSRFPQQNKVAVYKPLLSEVIDMAETYTQEKGLAPVYYNIETKSTPEGDGRFHPAPEQFVDLLMEVLYEKQILDRVIVQSFDVRTLQVMHRKAPDVSLALLVENRDGPEANLKKLGFTPTIYSPYHYLVDEPLVSWAHQKGMKVIPWTLNDQQDIRRMLGLGVDGIISDYPDRVFEQLTTNE